MTQDAALSSNDPDRIRQEIERTRAELSTDVDALTDKVSPSRVAERQAEKVKGAVGSVKDKVFGAAEDVRDAAQSASGSAGDAPGRVADKASGNPLAAGLIAFGAGLLVASLIPSTRQERQLVSQAKDSDVVQAATEGAKSVAQEMGQNLQEPARDAAQAVKQTATDGVEQVKSEASSGAEQVRSSGQHAAEDVRGQANEIRNS